MNARLFLLLAAVTPLFAQFTPIGAPSGSYTGSATLVPITQVNGTSVSSLTDGVQTISLSSALSAQTVPGGGWSTWNTPPAVESATPRVLARYSSLTSLTLTLSVPSNTFGFELEPDTFAVFTVSAAFMNGSTTLGTITLNPNGSAGALLFAATSTTPITSVVLTVPSGANGFAIAQLRYQLPASTATVPALTTTGICGLGALLAAAGAMLARKQQLA